MPEYFQLNSKEKKQEWLMLTFAILIFLTVAKGMYNQSHNIDQDYILVPFFMTMASGFFLVYGINGLTKGNLLPKWTPFYIFQFSCFLVRNIGSPTQDNVKSFSARLLGVLGLGISVACFTLAVITLQGHK